jgi:hypothetical protein
MQNSALREAGTKSNDRLLPVLAGLLSAAVVARLLVSTHRYNSLDLYLSLQLFTLH